MVCAVDLGFEGALVVSGGRDKVVRLCSAEDISVMFIQCDSIIMHPGSHLVQAIILFEYGM